MDTKNRHKTKPLNEVTLVKALRHMFKNMNSGKTVYLAFSRVSFRILIFVMAMSVIANIVLVDLLIHAPTVVEKTNVFIYIPQLILSTTAIIAGLWLFLKGVNIVTDR